MHILDNIVLVQEAIHPNIMRKGKGMTIKLDTENAFDCVRHNYLFIVLERFGFPPFFIKWMKSFILLRRNLM